MKFLFASLLITACGAAAGSDSSIDELHCISKKAKMRCSSDSSMGNRYLNSVASCVQAVEGKNADGTKLKVIAQGSGEVTLYASQSLFSSFYGSIPFTEANARGKARANIEAQLDLIPSCD